MYFINPRMACEIFFTPSNLVWVTSYPIAIGINFPHFCRVVSIFDVFSIFFSISLSSGLTMINHYDMKILVDHVLECVEKMHSIYMAIS